MSCKDKYLYVDEDTRRLIGTIKHERNKLGLSQRQLARAINISQTQICRYETGKIFPSLSIFLKLAKFFHWNISRNVNFRFKRSVKAKIHKQKKTYALTIAELQKLMHLSQAPIIEFLAGKGSICAFAQFMRVINEEKRRNNRK